MSLQGIFRGWRNKEDLIKKGLRLFEKYLSREFKHPDTGENTTLRKCFRIQAERLANFIKSCEMYTPFRIEG